MSQENVERIRGFYEHFNRTGEPDWDLFDPDAEIDPSEIVGMPRISLAGGKDPLRALLREMPPPSTTGGSSPKRSSTPVIRWSRP